MNQIILPMLRSDLQLQTYQQDNELYVVMYDQYGYAEEVRTLHVNGYNLLVSFSQQEITEEELRAIFKKETEDTEIVEQLLELIYQLDDDGFMLSEKFVTLKTQKDMAYLELPERPAICAGDSYPSEKSEITESLTKLFASAPVEKFAGSAKAVVAPHLDLRLGGELDYAYAAAYHSIRNSEADVYVILGTSHFISNDYFMFTEKPYVTPLGQATLDLDLLRAIDDELGDYMTIDDLAHKNEHSIEYQVLLLQHYFKPDVTILPILCGNLYDELESDDIGISSVRYNKIIEGIKATLAKLNKKAVFIASADLAHIGRKFGDDFDADTKLEELEKADLATINSLIADSTKGFLGNLFGCNDQWKVCGMSPITALTKICDYEKAELLHYNIWDQTETKSAVSFASLAFD